LDTKSTLKKEKKRIGKKEEMNKAHPSAASLYIGTGFAHMHSIVNAYGLI